MVIPSCLIALDESVHGHSLELEEGDDKIPTRGGGRRQDTACLSSVREINVRQKASVRHNDSLLLLVQFLALS